MRVQVPPFALSAAKGRRSPNAVPTSRRALARGRIRAVRRALAFGSAGVLVLTSARALASTPTDLLVERSPGAESCPDAPALHDAIVARTGIDPFVPGAREKVVVTYAFDAGHFTATLRMFAEDGALRGQRDLRSSGGACGELLAASALAVSIALQAIEPTRDPAPVPSAAPRPAAPPDPDDIPPADSGEPVPTAPPSRGVSLRGAADVVGALGAGPAPSLGGELALEGRSGAWSLELGVGALAPASGDAAGGGTVRTWTAWTQVLPCGWIGPLELCASAALDRIEGTATGIARPATSDGLFVSAGARVAIDVPAGPVTVRAHLGLAVPIDRPSVAIDGVAVWTMPVVTGACGLGVLFPNP